VKAIVASAVSISAIIITQLGMLIGWAISIESRLARVETLIEGGRPAIVPRPPQHTKGVISEKISGS